MVKIVLALLLAANLLFFGFTRGWFDGLFGLHARGDREPERIANQVRPTTIVLMPMASAPPGTSGSCLESAPVAAGEASAAEAALKAALPAGTWSDLRSESTVGTATVVSHVYRVGNADAAMAARLASLRLDSSGRGFSACARPEPGR
ncbi:MAG: hypothetical protein K8R60_10480 [Burkholderiales bacterium]|nr:hypothetical protein [Burkholderiales bacterium]